MTLATLKFALDCADEKPDGTIFLIPALLEKCEVPARLSRWQWVDLFEKDGYAKLIRSLSKRATSIGVELQNTNNVTKDSLLKKKERQRFLAIFINISNGGLYVLQKSTTLGKDYDIKRCKVYNNDYIYDYDEKNPFLLAHITIKHNQYIFDNIGDYFVNRKKFRDKTVLNDGDQIRINKSIFVFKVIYF